MLVVNFGYPETSTSFYILKEPIFGLAQKGLPNNYGPVPKRTFTQALKTSKLVLAKLTHGICSLAPLSRRAIPSPYTM